MLALRMMFLRLRRLGVALFKKIKKATPFTLMRFPIEPLSTLIVTKLYPYH